MAGDAKAGRGAAAEAIGFRLNEGPVGARPLPFRITYLGDGVVTVPGVGLFSRHTRAGAPADVAARLRADPAWRVEPDAGASPGAGRNGEGA